MNHSNPIVVVTGVGPGTGAAIVRRFAQGGYSVAMLARNRDRLAQLETEIANAHAYACDVTSEEQIDSTISGIRSSLGTPKVLIHRRRLWQFSDYRSSGSQSELPGQYDGVAEPRAPAGTRDDRKG